MNKSEKVHTAGGVADIELFYPYCKMAKDDDLNLSQLGVSNGDKIYYRTKPGVSVICRV
jgi:formylmethanofuran dehydrogenase subunit D